MTDTEQKRFDELGLAAPILKAVKEQGYDTPSPIQAQAIPAVLGGSDLLAAAQTGTGKTAGFTLPILHGLVDHKTGTFKKARSNHIRALIVTPTRELAAQVGESVEKYSKYLEISSAVVFGGVKINPQMMKLRRGVDVLVATPGRLLDLYNQNAVKFSDVEVLVLDEADRMLDMGFIHDIKRLLKALPKQRQNLLFSATFSPEIRALAKGLVVDPKEISVTPRNAAATTVNQWLVPVDKKQKTNLLIHLVKERAWQQVLVFSRTKHGANKITKLLEASGIKAAAIHGNKSQGARQRALADFKSMKIRVLVATDIAARGIDIDQLPQVVNFDLPNVSEDYVHRIGRTGRAGASGEAVSLVCADEFTLLADIERLIKKLIDREYVEGYEPVHELPESRLNTKPFKAKKPKTPKPDHKNGQRPAGDKPSRPSRKPNAHGKSAGANGSRSNGPGSKGSSSKNSASKKQGAKKQGFGDSNAKRQSANGNTANKSASRR